MSNLIQSTKKSHGLHSPHTPIDLSTQWHGAVVIRVKSVRCLALNGRDTLCIGDLTVPQAAGCMEVIGSRTGIATTSLLIGFSDGAHCPPPTFALRGNQAVGTLVVLSRSFAAWLEIAKSSTAHMRLGGNGQWNALASDAAMLELPS